MSRSEVTAVPEDPPSADSLATPTSPDGDPSPDGDSGRGAAAVADGTHLAGAIAGHLTNQARRTASAARAGRLTNNGAEPGVLDLTPMQDLLTELMDEFSRLRLRDRVARALRQAADIIDSQPPSH
jgi:hypothetical protein